jgi:uncharacterized protein (TIGR00369 family)
MAVKKSKAVRSNLVRSKLVRAKLGRSKPRRSGAGHDTRYLKLQKNYCFACGTDNPAGMQLRFTLDEDRKCFVCHFRLSKRYSGPPGHCHGGIIATILDEAMGKVNKLRQVIAVTSEMTVRYLRPVPLKHPLRVESREVKVEGRKHINVAEILNEKGEVLARSQGLFIAIDAERMFKRFAKSQRAIRGTANRHRTVK